jgi:cation transport ATPase
VPAPAVRSVELAIGGMTCAACAARVERKLDGVRPVMRRRCPCCSWVSNSLRLRHSADFSTVSRYTRAAHLGDNPPSRTAWTK